MKPAKLNRELECDDGYFNIKWWLEHPKIGRRICEYKTPGAAGKKCEDQGFYWCQDCGLLVCRKHRKNHKDSFIHKVRMEQFSETV